MIGWTWWLAIFSEFEAYLISQLSEIKSIEELISIDPELLIESLNNHIKTLGIEDKEFSLGDANRWQRTLDDLILEYQEDYLE